MWPFKKKKPVENYKTNTLADVLTNLYLRDLYETQKGFTVGGDMNSVGPIVQKEFDLIDTFKVNNNYSYDEVELIFWSPEFVQNYYPLNITEKIEHLDNLLEKEFKLYAQEGKKVKKDASINSISNYLTTVAFDQLKYNLPIPDK